MFHKLPTKESQMKKLAMAVLCAFVVAGCSKDKAPGTPHYTSAGVINSPIFTDPNIHVTDSDQIQQVVWAIQSPSLPATRRLTEPYALSACRADGVGRAGIPGPNKGACYLVTPTGEVEFHQMQGAAYEVYYTK